MNRSPQPPSLEERQRDDVLCRQPVSSQSERMVVHRASVLLEERPEGVLIPGAHARAQAQLHALPCPVPIGEFPVRGRCECVARHIDVRDIRLVMAASTLRDVARTRRHDTARPAAAAWMQRVTGRAASVIDLVADAIFEERRLAEIRDPLDPIVAILKVMSSTPNRRIPPPQRLPDHRLCGSRFLADADAWRSRR